MCFRKISQCRALSYTMFARYSLGRSYRRNQYLANCDPSLGEENTLDKFYCWYSLKMLYLSSVEADRNSHDAPVTAAAAVRASNRLCLAKRVGNTGTTSAPNP